MQHSNWQELFRGRDVVVISPQFWGDLWVSKHWIASELSRYSRVVFVEPALWVGGLIREPRRLPLHMNRLLKPLRKVKDNLFVFSPKLLPGVLGTEPEQLVAQARRLAARMNLRDTVVLNFGTNYEFASSFNNAVSVYYCVDPFYPTPGRENAERETCARSDVIFAVSDAYRDLLQQYGTGRPIHVIPHGFAFEHAREIDAEPASSMPPELVNLPRPIWGFAGSIHDSCVDLDRLEYIARARPKTSIVMIGPHRNNPIGADLSPQGLARIQALGNVHLLGPRHFLELPRYVRHFDVGLVLINTKDYDGTDKTSKRTLFKWLLYLSLGKPVVAPLMSEATRIADLVYLARDDAQYLEFLDRATAERGERRDARIQYSSQFSFDNMLNRMADALRANLSVQTRPAAPASSPLPAQ
jgi:hypothetical protein